MPKITGSVMRDGHDRSLSWPMKRSSAIFISSAIRRFLSSLSREIVKLIAWRQRWQRRRS